MGTLIVEVQVSGKTICRELPDADGYLYQVLITPVEKTVYRPLPRAVFNIFSVATVILMIITVFHAYNAYQLDIGLLLYSPDFVVLFFLMIGSTSLSLVAGIWESNTSETVQVNINEK